MTDAYPRDRVRTPIGRYGGSLSSVRTDDLAAGSCEPSCNASPASRRRRSMRSFLAAPTRPGRTIAMSRGWRAPVRAAPSVPGTTVNRLCGSGLEAVLIAARQIRQ